MATFPGAQALSEWFSPVGGFIEGCGEASALVAAHIVNGTAINPGELTSVIQAAVRNHQTVDPSGAQTGGQVQWDLAQMGVPSTVQYGASGAIPAIDAALASGVPVVVGVSQGSQLTGEPAGLRGHFVTIVGANSQGYVVADPNTPQATQGGFVNDTAAQIQQANPFATITPTPSTTASVGNVFGPILGSNALTSQAISGGISGAAQSIGQTILSALGLSNSQDLVWRGGLILVGLILLVIGLVMLTAEAGGAVLESPPGRAAVDSAGRFTGAAVRG